MHTRSKLAFAALATTLLMAFATSTASARILSASGSDFRVIWNPLALTDDAGNPVVECPVTLEGTFHSQTIAKVIRSLIGYVTRAISAATEPPCINGTATVQSETLPWHLTYEGFTGRLPNITAIRLLLKRVSFVVTVLGIRCLYREQGAAIENAAGEVVRELSNGLLRLIPDPAIRIRKFSGSVLCPNRGGFLNTSNIITRLNSSTKLSIELI